MIKLRINAMLKSMQYNDHRKLNDKSEYNIKQSKDNANVSFFEILMQVKEDLYLQKDVEE